MSDPVEPKKKEKNNRKDQKGSDKVDKAAKAKHTIDLLNDSESLQYPKFTNTSPSGGGVQSRVATKPVLQTATSAGGPAEDDNVDRFLGSSPAGLSFGYDERACMSPPVSPPAGGVWGFNLNPNFMGSRGSSRTAIRPM